MSKKKAKGLMVGINFIFFFLFAIASNHLLAYASANALTVNKTIDYENSKVTFSVKDLNHPQEDVTIVIMEEDTDKIAYINQNALDSSGNCSFTTKLADSRYYGWAAGKAGKVEIPSFTIKSMPITSLVSPTAVSVISGNAVTLPARITAIYSDGTQDDVAVTWNAVDTSSIGTKTVEGTVEGNYAGKATITVIVLQPAGNGGNETPPENSGDSGNSGNSGNTGGSGYTNTVPVQVVVDNSSSTPKVVINFDSAAIAKDKVNEVKPTISDTIKALELKVKVDSIKGGTGSLALSANKLTMSIPFSIMDLSNVQQGAYAKLEQTTSSTDESLKGTKGIGEVLNFNLGLYNSEGTKLSEVHTFAQGKVKIEIKLTDAQIKSLNLSKLAACYYNEDKNKWEYVGGSYDSTTKIFSFETEHFSKFTVTDMSSAPVFDEVVTQNAAQGSFLQFKVNATSANNMSLTYTVEKLPAGASFDAVSQNLNWTPNVDQAGSYTISFSVTDGATITKQNVIVVVRDVKATELVEKALLEKDFYHFNIAYFKVVKLSDEKEKAENLDKLATIHNLVWNSDIANINKILEDLVATGSGKIYDDVQAVINNTNLSAIDKGYLLGEVTSWGKELVFTEEYKAAVDALMYASDKKDSDSISKAETAIAKVTNKYSKEYLMGELKNIKVD